MFAKSGWAVTGHIDLKPVNSSTLCEGDFLSFVVFRFRLSGALENLFMKRILIDASVILSRSFLIMLRTSSL